MRPELATILSLLSARRGHFEYESGLHGDLRLERSRLFAQPSLVAPLVASLAGALPEVDVVCGPMPGGAFLAELVAADQEVECCFAERHEDGSERYGVRYRIPRADRARLLGKTVAVVEDVYDSGDAVGQTVDDLTTLGASPVAVGALLVLQTPRGRGKPSMWARDMWNIGLHPASVAVADRSVWTPANCPRCAFGVPLDERSAADLPAGET
ncbi:hypothetical protein [Saccharopolyspora sp. 5N708]|uniref:hypothetical protein n=1 Tax=Saccharopolyspora sp. 5N708 TaxID=3457424 RepID=UPI003FD03437